MERELEELFSEEGRPGYPPLTFLKCLIEGRSGLLNSTFGFLKDKLLKRGVIVDASVTPAPKSSAGAEEGGPLTLGSGFAVGVRGRFWRVK